MLQITEQLERGRLLTGHYRSKPGNQFGIFELHGPCGRMLRMMATDGLDTGWEHVSVSSGIKRPPNWQEMCWVKNLFWGPEDCVVQFHPPASKYVNNHPACLHLWRHRVVPFPLPHEALVGDKALGNLAER